MTADANAVDAAMDAVLVNFDRLLQLVENGGLQQLDDRQFLAFLQGYEQARNRIRFVERQAQLVGRPRRRGRPGIRLVRDQTLLGAAQQLPHLVQRGVGPGQDQVRVKELIVGDRRTGGPHLLEQGMQRVGQLGLVAGPDGLLDLVVERAQGANRVLGRAPTGPR